MADEWLQKLQLIAPRLIPWAVWLLLVGASVMAARMTWYLLEPVPEVRVRPLPIVNQGVANNNQQGPIQLSEQLFGEYQKQAVVQTPVVEDAPETRLNLTLQGVFATGSPENGSAVIARSGSTGEYFAVGADVFGEATLHQVFANRVILQRNNQFETLKFDDAPSTGGGALAVNNQVSQDLDRKPTFADRDDEPDAEDQISRIVDDIREEAMINPEGLIRRMGLKVTEEGYEVTRRARQLMAYGLRPNDVVVSVNGQSVGNIAQDQILIDQLSLGGDVEIEIQRGSRRFKIYHTIPTL